jgi:hypothetical protein
LSLKRTDLARLKAAGISDRLRKSPIPERYGSGSAIISRREQRKRDQADGLVPFAVKLKSDLVKRLHERANKLQRPLNEVVTELLSKGLK